jgi:multicomponent Na+:H+ antiporter subunit F
MRRDMCALWVMLAFMAVYFVRVAQGPSIWDRLLGLSLISTKILLIIILLASYFDLSYLLDLAIVYVLLGFISTVFIAHFILERVKNGSAK